MIEDLALLLESTELILRFPDARLDEFQVEVALLVVVCFVAHHRHLQLPDLILQLPLLLIFLEFMVALLSHLCQSLHLIAHYDVGGFGDGGGTAIAQLVILTTLEKVLVVHLGDVDDVLAVRRTQLEAGLCEEEAEGKT